MHMSRVHKEAYSELQQVENERKQAKEGLKRKCSDYSADPPAKVQSLEQCVHRRATAWHSDSNEYKKRVSSLLNMLISTGYPLALVDQPSFRDLMHTMDPKFVMPGACLCLQRYANIISVYNRNGI